jgi:alpha-tubulin suppressor-like RCC1 family protein
MSAGEEATCAVKLDGTLWCWGKNLWGQLGIGTTQESTTPAQVKLP